MQRLLWLRSALSGVVALHTTILPTACAARRLVAGPVDPELLQGRTTFVDFRQNHVVV
jgi:hypothetical protein